MITDTYRGVVRGGVIVILDEQNPLQEGTEVLVTPTVLVRGTSAAVLAALTAAPPVPAEWVDELEQQIAAGRRPPTSIDPFADEQDNPEG